MDEARSRRSTGVMRASHAFAAGIPSIEKNDEAMNPEAGKGCLDFAALEKQLPANCAENGNARCGNENTTNETQGRQRFLQRLTMGLAHTYQRYAYTYLLHLNISHNF